MGRSLAEMVPPTPQGVPVAVTPEGQPIMENDAVLTDSDCTPLGTIETSSDEDSNWVRYRSLAVDPPERDDSESDDDEPDGIFMTPESMAEEETPLPRPEVADDESTCSEEDVEDKHLGRVTSDQEEPEDADDDENHGAADQSDPDSGVGGKTNQRARNVGRFRHCIGRYVSGSASWTDSGIVLQGKQPPPPNYDAQCWAS
eukprot:8845847-Karenia_brevis.AAC.1